MGQRLTYSELEKIKEEMNASALWSWSRISLYSTDLYGYFLKYIKKVPEDNNSSIYGVAGSIVHDLCELFQAGTITREEMIEQYEEAIYELEVMDYKFDRNDEDKNENIKRKYHDCNRHFMRNFKPIETENGESEKLITIKVGKFSFIGYEDFKHTEIRDGVEKLIITDWKTSTIYTGEKINKEKGQLVLYALGESQRGWKIEDIIIRWCFTKYVSVEVTEKKGNTKIRNIERNEIGNKLSASAKMWLKDTKRYTEDEIESYLTEMLILNTIENLPEDVQSKFKISECYVEIPFNQSEIDELVSKIVETIIEAKKKEVHYEKTKDDTVFCQEIDKTNSYFVATLSGYSSKLHKPYKFYLDELANKEKERESDNDLLGIGKKLSKSKSTDDDDFDIMALLDSLEDE